MVEGDGDDAGLFDALRSRGIFARWLAWDDPQILDADLVILRAAWDYPQHYEAFLDWITQVRHLVNAPQVVAWNSDKRYLADLAAAGVPTVPSDFSAPGESIHIPTGEVVVKPTVGAGSVGVQRFTDSSAARAHAATLHADGYTALIQPYDARIAAGETALVFIGGEQSHAFSKGPMLPAPGQTPAMDASGTYAEEKLARADPDFEVWDVGHAALSAAAEHLGIGIEEFLYARVDVIGDRHDPRLLELELIEPSLGWRQLGTDDRAVAQRRFALAVASALERFGLGPLSKVKGHN